MGRRGCRVVISPFAQVFPIDEKLIECAHLAEDIVGHELPGKVQRAGSLAHFRARMKAAA